MATALEGEPLETDLEIEAILNAMEAASPGSRAEHIGGSFTLNRPRPLHQRALMRLIMAIDQTLADDLEVLPEPRVRSGDTWIVPDIVVAPKALIDRDLAMLDPADLLLIAEVLSPSTATKDRGPKREFCEQHGVDYWIVEPASPDDDSPRATIKVFHFGSGVVRMPGT